MTVPARPVQDEAREAVAAVLDSTEWHCADDHDWGGRQMLTGRLLAALSAREPADEARETVARAIAEANSDDVFDRYDEGRDEGYEGPTQDDEDRAYYLRLADAALAALSAREPADEARHERAWAGHGPDLGANSGAYCVQCSEVKGDYEPWPCAAAAREPSPTGESDD